MINLIQPLPFFDRLKEQERFKESCDGLYKFLCPGDKIIPFQIAIPAEYDTIQAITIRGFNCVFDIDIAVNIGKIKIISSAGKKWIISKGDQLIFVRQNGVQEPLLMPPGYYWIEITVNGKTFFSEVFCVPGQGICDEAINMEIEAWNDTDSNGRTFADGFRFRAYFHSFITNVIPDITEEFAKDGYERQIPIRKVIVFNYNVELDPMPNTVSIGMAYLTTLKNLVINHNGNQYVTRDISYKPDSVEGGSLDTVQLTFSLEGEDIVKTNCN